MVLDPAVLTLVLGGLSTAILGQAGFIVWLIKDQRATMLAIATLADKRLDEKEKQIATVLDTNKQTRDNEAETLGLLRALTKHMIGDDDTGGAADRNKSGRGTRR